MYGVASNLPQGVLGLLDALREPTRVRLLKLLEEQELGVAELCEILQLPQSTVSRHLKVLSDLAFLHSRRQGTTHLYRLEPAALDARAARLWSLVAAEIEGWATLAQDRVRLEALLANRRAGGRAFFDDAAHRWDVVRRELYGSGYAVAALAQLLEPGRVIADLGCGNGEFAVLLASRGARVIAVDQSDEMLRQASARGAGVEGLDLRLGELEALPIDDRACDAAFLLLGLSYVDDPRAAVGEMARILRPGGRAVIVDQLRHDREDFKFQTGQLHMGFDADAMRGWMRAHGLEPGVLGPLAPDPGVTGPALLLATGDRMANHATVNDRKEIAT
jgi:SAM-dependent methyltransferase/predicted transcriptional regulator